MEKQNRSENDVTAKLFPDSAERHYKYPLLGFLILSLLIFYVYYPSFKFDFIYDDFVVIKKQQSLTGIHDVVRIFQERHYPTLPYYRPVVRTTLLLQKTIYGDNPAPFHQFNTFLLWIAAICVYWLLRQPQINMPRLLAFMISGIFALHPVVSASVYPIASGRETLLPGIFMILTMISYFKKGKIWYIWTLVFFTVALFGKEQAVMLLPLFVIGDLAGMKDDPSRRKISYWLKRYAPMAIILLIYMQIRFSLFEGTEFSPTIFNEPLKPLLTPLYALQSIFAPFYDEVYEPRHAKIWLSIPRLVIAMLSVFALSCGIYKYADQGRSLFIFWGSWFVLSVLPTANVIVQEAAFSERYVLQSYLALLMICAFILAQIWCKKRVRPFMIIIGIVVMMILANFTMNRGNFFIGEVEFYKQWIRVNPDHPDSYLVLSEIYLQKGDIDQALHYSSKAFTLKPDYIPALEHMAIILGEKGEFEKAVEYFHRALALNPNVANTRLNFGVFYFRNKKYELAIREFKKCLELDPSNPVIYYNLSLVYESMNQKLLAEEYYRKGYSLSLK